LPVKRAAGVIAGGAAVTRRNFFTGTILSCQLLPLLDPAGVGAGVAETPGIRYFA